jgi:UDP-N-acetylglucosamine acyltransferase
MSIHPTAVIDPTAELAEDVEIGPYAVIEAGVRIGRGTWLMPHAFVGRGTILGEENQLHVGAVVGHAPQDISTTGLEDARLIAGDRNIFREYCTIHRAGKDGQATMIGNDNLIMTQAHIAHDCQFGNGIILAGGSLVAGHIHVEDRAFISGNVAIHQFCRIGTLAMCAGLARVNRDVPPYFMVKGDSKIHGLNVVGLKRAGMTEAEIRDVRQAYRILYRKGLPLAQALRRIETTLPHSPHAAHLVDFIRKTTRGISPHHRRGGGGIPRQGEA